MTVFENIKTKNIDELVEWLDKFETHNDITWIRWWDGNYCNKCESETIYFEELNREEECAWCETHDSCKFFDGIDGVPSNKQVIKMWLESEAK